jgi:predicted MFS family arabinose efflux permease
MVASGVAAMAAWPVARLRFPPVQKAESKVYPRSRFMIGFLIPLACWSLAVGAFNPFFNAFFAQRLRMSVARIGLVVSFSQISQALAMLLAPAVLKRLGQVRGIAVMQLATALGLASLAISPSARFAVAAYLGYMSFQYMSEPGLFSLLMSRVAPGERSGASALFFLVTSLAGSIAATVGGSGVVRFGYPAVLVAAASLVAAAAFLFRILVQEQACPITSATSF